MSSLGDTPPYPTPSGALHGAPFFLFATPAEASLRGEPGGERRGIRIWPFPAVGDPARSPPSQRLFLGSSAVEQPAVNRLVVGSNPTRGAIAPDFML